MTLPSDYFISKEAYKLLCNSGVLYYHIAIVSRICIAITSLVLRI